MSDTLAQAETFAFSTSESLDLILPAADRKMVRFERTVSVRRPDATRFELRATDGPAADVSAYYEGTNLLLYDKLHGAWARTVVPGTLDEMLDDVARRYGLPVPVADVIYSVPYGAFIGPATRGGFAGRETIDGVDCALLAYADDFVGIRIWLPSSGTPLPRRLELTYKQAPGTPLARIDFTHWDLAPQIDGNTFTAPAPDAAAEVTFERFVTTMMSGGAPPPGPAPAQPAEPGSAEPDSTL